jgi:hypothetical protein
VIRFDPALFTDFADVLANAQQIAGDTVITFNAANSVTLNGVTLASLHQNDFTFA